MIQPPGTHLAEYNFGTLRHGWDDPRSAAFVAGLDLVNGIAETSAGFVWRAVDECPGTEGASEGDLLPQDLARIKGEGFASTLSIWEGVESLEHFVWNTVHRQFYGRKAEWYDAAGNGNLVLWWVPKGARPTEAEGMLRWRHRESYGDTDRAFGWHHLKQASLVQQHGCTKTEAV